MIGMVFFSILTGTMTGVLSITAGPKDATMFGKRVSLFSFYSSGVISSWYWRDFAVRNWWYTCSGNAMCIQGRSYNPGKNYVDT
jgi:hypothetical protein